MSQLEKMEEAIRQKMEHKEIKDKELEKQKTQNVEFKKNINQKIQEQRDSKMKEILEEADKDNDGFIGFEDFYRIMRKRGDDPLEDWSSDEENV